MSSRDHRVIGTVEDLDERTVITVEDFARLMGIGRSAAYEAARRDEFPVRRVGRRLFVPVPALKRWLGVDLDTPAPEPTEETNAVAELERTTSKDR